MLKVQNQDYFNKVKLFAEKRGLAEQLQNKLDYLDTYAEHGDRGATICYLYSDFAPQSFEFEMMKRNDKGDYEHWFSGGLIYFGSGDTGVGAPQFSVRIGNTNEGWSIHT